MTKYIADPSLPPIIVNIRRAEVADPTTLGKPHGLMTRPMFTGWKLRNVAQKTQAYEWSAHQQQTLAEMGPTPERGYRLSTDVAQLRKRPYVEVTMRLDDAIEWSCCPGSKTLTRHLDRLTKPFGAECEDKRQPKYGLLANAKTLGGERLFPLVPTWQPVIDAYELRGKKLWFRVPQFYVFLPKDRFEMNLGPWEKILGKPKAWEELMRETVRELDRMAADLRRQGR